MNIRYRVDLTDDERNWLRAFLAGGKQPVRKIQRAQVLLAADEGQSDENISVSVGVGTATVFRTRRRFVEGNMEHALAEAARPGAPRKLSPKEEAILVATACSKPPPGQARWTMKLLAGKLVELTDHDSVSDETVRRRLEENEIKPWQKTMWCVPEINGEYVARMEDVLDLYAAPPDAARPVVSFDESPVQLIGEVRDPIRAEPGQPERYDSEYKRNGTVNLFVAVDVNRPWRKVVVTDHRASKDFAEQMRALVDDDYPEAEVIRLVMDNLSTHTMGALYETFAPEEARRIASRLEVHYVPKHASWLNMVEIEIGVLKKQCLDRRIGEKAEMKSEISAWERRRNLEGARINWMFTKERAREKMGRSYPVQPERVEAAA